jgi:dTDP-glucose pyrophosphorylase
MKGVILAAGEGKRIRKVTYGAFPKEFLPIGNVPAIRFPMEALRLVGINHILIVIAPQTKHGIMDGLQSGKKLGVNVCYVVQENENKLRGIGQAILSTRGWIDADEDFLVACGDSIVCDFSSKNPLDCLKPLMKLHCLLDGIATIFVHPAKLNPSRFGVVKFRNQFEDDGRLYGEVEALVEKPSKEVAEAYRHNGYYYIITGYYAFKPRIFSFIDKTKIGVGNEIQITDAMRLALNSGEKVYAVVHGTSKGNTLSPYEYWDVGIPEQYKEANSRLMEVSIDQIIYNKG